MSLQKKQRKRKQLSKLGASALSEDILVHDSKEIGKAIRAARARLDLLQAEAAAMCDVSPKFLSELEQGKESAHLGKSLNVLRTLGLKLVITPSAALRKLAKDD